MNITLTQHGRWLPADVQTPISLFLGLVGDQPGILLESAEVDGRLGRYTLMAWDFRLLLRPVDGKLSVEVTDSRLEELKQLEGIPFLEGIRQAGAALTIKQEATGGGRDAIPAFTRGLYGYFGYGTAGMMEPKLAASMPPSEAEACLALPGQLVLFDHLRHSCCYLSLDESGLPKPATPEWGVDLTAPAIGEPEVHPGMDEYMQQVKTAKELIAEGEGIQIVLSTRFKAPVPDEPFRIYRRLRQANPSPFMFFMRFPGETGTLLGSSPEMMVRCQEGRLEVRPIAGTRPRGSSETEDLMLAQDLLNDPKERAEHVMLVDLGRNDLGRIAKPGTVNVEKFMNVEHFSHVMHLTSYVSAELKEGLDAIDVLSATFPAGTLSGAPKVWAMETIAEMEPQSRGPYGGCIGWIGLNSDEGDKTVNLDTGITIRSMWIRDGYAYWQAGAGIVYDSDPLKEWEECNNKARIIKEVISGTGGTDVFTHR